MLFAVFCKADRTKCMLTWQNSWYSLFLIVFVVTDAAFTQIVYFFDKPLIICRCHIFWNWLNIIYNSLNNDKRYDGRSNDFHQFHHIIYHEHCFYLILLYKNQKLNNKYYLLCWRSLVILSGIHADFNMPRSVGMELLLSSHEHWEKWHVHYSKDDLWKCNDFSVIHNIV